MSSEEILAGFLSKDAHKIIASSHAIIHSVITDRNRIKALHPYLDDIKEATQGISYGGAILPNQRFVDKALKVIEDSMKPDCLCEYSFDDFGQSVQMLKKVGFVVHSEKTENYITTGVIECPNCHQRYIVEEEFTGWHVTSSRHRAL